MVCHAEVERALPLSAQADPLLWTLLTFGLHSQGRHVVELVHETMRSGVHGDRRLRQGAAAW